MSKKAQINLKTNEIDDFVGFEYKNGEITVCYPMTLKLFNDGNAHKVLDCNKDKNAIRLLAILIRSFKLAVYKDRVNDQSPTEENKAEVIDYPIEAYDYMIQDYQRNGRYIEFEHSYSLNGNGKIDWKRTLRQTPYFVDGSPVFFDVITKQKHIISNIINDIYLFCVYESILKFGSWFYGMNSGSIPAKNRTLKPDLKKLYIHTLNAKIAETFNDDTINRLTNMLLIVEGANEADGIQRMGLKSYHSVFERLIKWGLDNVGDLSKYNPQAYWNSESAEDDNLSPLRMDALRVENNTAYILDAKFYQTSKPGSADINKQITYGDNLYTKHDEFVKKGLMYSENNIYNFFFVPQLLSNDEENMISYSGFKSKSGWRNNTLSYESIYLLNIDLTALLEKWNKNDHETVIKAFYDAIGSI